MNRRGFLAVAVATTMYALAEAGLATLRPAIVKCPRLCLYVGVIGSSLTPGAKFLIDGDQYELTRLPSIETPGAGEWYRVEGWPA